MQQHNKDFVSREELELILQVMISHNTYSKSTKADIENAFKKLKG